MERPRHFDVAVIGAGPAGATAAHWLAERGHRVALFHRPARTSPADPVWETLSPGALELLRFGHPDLWLRLEQHLVPCRATVLWSRADSKSSTARPAVLVNRRKLDPLLRESALGRGATLFSSARAVSCGGGFALIATDEGASIRCRFLINAAGRHSVMREGRLFHSPRTVALNARVGGVCLDAEATHVEAAAEAWLWALRSGDANASVTLFVALETAHRWQREDRSAAFLRCLGKTSLGAGPGRLHLSSPIRALNATIAEQPPVVSGCLVHIGDAAIALDPLASQGIHYALLSARQAGAALNTSLVRNDAALAKSFLSARHGETLQHHLSTCAALYRRQDIFDTPFWNERANPVLRPQSAFPQEIPFGAEALLDSSFALCPRVRWETVPVLAGDLIESRRALCHPHLSRPIAFLEEQSPGDLLFDLPPSFTGAWLLQRWINEGLSASTASRAFVFLARNRVLVARGVEPGQRNGDGTTVHLEQFTASPAQLAPLSRR